MPYPGEHSARLQDPKKFNPETYRRTEGGTIYGKIRVPKTIGIIWGKLKGKDKPADKPIPQALRFPTKYWTVEKAKKWLKDNNVKYQKFEPAKKGKSQAEAAEGRYTCECLKCGHTIQTDKHCKDIKCPKCGGKMRRKERPGPGRGETLESTETSASANIFALIAQLETQFWVMEPRALQGLFTQLGRQDIYLPDYIELKTRDRIKTLQIKNGTATIEIKGILMRELPRAFAVWGIEGTSYVQIADQVSRAVKDDKVKDILLKVNSPGGTVPGVLETADIIRQAREHKPVNAIIDNIGASGAYWLTSQAQDIRAEPNSEVGSIGVFTVYIDSSKRAADLGFKVHVIRSGEHKGMGIPGVEITETQISAIQEIIDGIADNFIASVADGRGRKEKEVRQWATGQLWLADKAVELGLIDQIYRSNALKAEQVVNKEKSMDVEQEQVDAQVELNQAIERTQSDERKRLADLHAAFPDDMEFALQAFEKGLTVEQAKAEYCDILQQRAKQAAENKETKTSGAKAIATEGSDDEAKGDFMAEARSLMDEGKAKTMTEAMRKVRRQQPQLHEDFKERCRIEGKGIYNEVA